ncbi:type II toxin-antitoxin system VapC family toxin [Marinobacter sp.]|uniref:type II toxin-antitoxin system VapC family toxin n=1 Tax=Marinobacter sp. TaxID=50741 RepID=UPI0019C005F1|nr:type II toxin-antitoxin system VapC family toxin [Marinobacter sp.]MBD3655357.1 type II toxin-antitoxin system VapC family toxin [Marinobacter sp.]
MSGRYLLDTNAIIYAFNRKLKLPVAQYVVSVITKMELLSWPALTPGDELKLREILQNLAVIELDPPIQDAAVKVRKNTSLKLPDSIISATAIYGGFVLVTDDEKLASRHVGRAVTLDQLMASTPES